MKKINFKSISSELTREEMKNVMAGSGTGCIACVTSGGPCVSDAECWHSDREDLMAFCEEVYPACTIESATMSICNGCNT